MNGRSYSNLCDKFYGFYVLLTWFIFTCVQIWNSNLFIEKWFIMWFQKPYSICCVCCDVVCCDDVNIFQHMWFVINQPAHSSVGWAKSEYWIRVLVVWMKSCGHDFPNPFQTSQAGKKHRGHCQNSISFGNVCVCVCVQIRVKPHKLSNIIYVHFDTKHYPVSWAMKWIKSTVILDKYLEFDLNGSTWNIAILWISSTKLGSSASVIVIYLYLIYRKM